ncbi:MAG TPA: VOC family protein [Solirubrobacteraceae bacterium]|jgi:catechol 2,3-dioxygenase|nr:VOC family protein [Solirubrobacteraceae bacterium]
MAITSSHSEGAVASRIDPDTSVGTVRLTVADLDRSRVFYEQVIGLRSIELDGGTVALGAAGERPLIELRGDSTAPHLSRRAPGLYHLAILVPTRLDLAFALARLAEARYPLDGASDHLVSEALYLSDPDGNGIEIYRDRPRADWPRAGDQLQMSTLPLDLDDLIGELRAATGLQAGVPSGTKIGHVHLQVSDLSEAEGFYNGVLGFDVIVRGYPSALFVSAGGYHHHIGLNTWHSAGAAPAPEGSVGLRSFEIELPDEPALEAVLARLDAASIPSTRQDDGVRVRDPFGNGVVLRTRTAAG